MRRGDVIVEFGVEEADDLAALVVADGLVRGVPEHGDGVATVVGGVGGKVEIFEVVSAGELFGLGGYLGGGDGFGGGCEAPACGVGG